jgi:hypothetical protein
MQPHGEHAWVDVEPGLVGSADPPFPPVDLLGKRHQREIPGVGNAQGEVRIVCHHASDIQYLRVDTPASHVSRWETR